MSEYTCFKTKISNGVAHVIMSRGNELNTMTRLFWKELPEIIKTIEKPIFGVCLGHQAIGVAFGGEVIKANEPIHGKLSLINHSESGVFKDIENPYNVVRYHSLIVNPENLSDELEITATLVEDENMIMGLSHKTKPIVGVQFHPESIDTKFGKKLINNFLKS